MKKEGELLILDGLEGNPRGDILTHSQEFLLSYYSIIEKFWLIALIVTMLYLFGVFIVRPLINQFQNSLKN